MVDGVRLSLLRGGGVFSGEVSTGGASAVDGMDGQGAWRGGASASSRISYKNATVAVCAINLLACALLLRNYYSSWPRIAGDHRFDSGTNSLYSCSFHSH